MRISEPRCPAVTASNDHPVETVQSRPRGGFIHSSCMSLGNLEPGLAVAIVTLAVSLAMIRSAFLATVFLGVSTLSALAESSDSGLMPIWTDLRAPSFQMRSGQYAGGPANELNTGDGRATETLPDGDVLAVAASRKLYHGNYCGPGDRGRGKPGIDALDEACRRHDACYDAAGIRDCACDAQLKQEVMTLAENAKLSRTLRARAASVAESTVFMGCVAR